MTNLRTVLVLGFVAMGLLAYIVFYESTTASTDEARAAKGRLFHIDQSGIARVQITNPQGTFVFEKQNGRWRLMGPVNAPVSMADFSQVLNWIELGYSGREIDYKLIKEDGIHTLRRFGLVPPEIRVDFRGPDIGQHVLLVGRQVANTPQAYAKTTDEKEATIRIVPLELRELLSKGLADYRGRQIFDLDQGLVTGGSVVLPNGGGTKAEEFEVRRTDNRAWQMRKPLVTRADHKAVLGWINQAMRLQVAEFVSDENANLTKYGLATPTGRITLAHGPEGRETVLLLGGPAKSGEEGEERLYAKLLDNPTVFTVNREEVYGVLNALAETRDRKFAPLDLERIVRVRIDQPDGPDIDTQVTPETWVLAEERTPINSTAVFDLLNEISGTKVTRFVKDAAVDLAPYGLDEPRATIIVTASPLVDGQPLSELTIRLGKFENGELFATTSEGPFIYAVPASLLRRLPLQPWDWRHLRAVDTHLEHVRGLAVVHADGKRAEYTRQPNGTYTTDAPGYGVDAITADQQAALLTRLRALRWLGPPQPDFGLDKPTERYELTLDDGKTITVLIGRELPTIGHAAMVDGDKYAFELAPEDHKILKQNPLVRTDQAAPATSAPAIPDLQDQG